LLLSPNKSDVRQNNRHVTHCEDFSSNALWRLGVGGCPNSCLNRSTSCLATAYSPSVKVVILTRRSAHLGYKCTSVRLLKARSYEYSLSCDRHFQKVSLGNDILLTRDHYGSYDHLHTLSLSSLIYASRPCQITLSGLSCNAPLASSSVTGFSRFLTYVAPHQPGAFSQDKVTRRHSLILLFPDILDCFVFLF
jgi:hypothetical protein